MSDTLSANDLEGAQVLLKEIFDEVVEEEGVLAGGNQLGTGGEALKDLRESKVTFGYPQDRLTQLTTKLLKKMAIELDPIEKQQFKDQYDYYYLAMPVSLHPKRGNLFHLVECQLEFRTKNNQPVIIKSLFPESKWRTVLEWGGGMNLALNGALDWDIGVSEGDLAEVVKKSGVPTGHIKTNNTIQSRILVPNYSFQIGREEMTATGKGNNYAIWRLRDPELKQVHDLQFVVIFKVPKGTEEIILTGKVFAQPDIELLAAELDDVFSELSEKIKRIFRKSEKERKDEEHLRIGSHEIWEPLKLPHL